MSNDIERLAQRLAEERTARKVKAKAFGSYRVENESDVAAIAEGLEKDAAAAGHTTMRKLHLTPEQHAWSEERRRAVLAKQLDGAGLLSPADLHTANRKLLLAHCALGIAALGDGAKHDKLARDIVRRTVCDLAAFTAPGEINFDGELRDSAGTPIDGWKVLYAALRPTKKACTTDEMLERAAEEVKEAEERPARLAEREAEVARWTAEIERHEACVDMIDQAMEQFGSRATDRALKKAARKKAAKRAAKERSAARAVDTEMEC
jgi:hypothetical protein